MAGAFDARMRRLEKERNGPPSVRCVLAPEGASADDLVAWRARMEAHSPKGETLILVQVVDALETPV